MIRKRNHKEAKTETILHFCVVVISGFLPYPVPPPFYPGPPPPFFGPRFGQGRGLAYLGSIGLLGLGGPLGTVAGAAGLAGLLGSDLARF